MLLIVIPIAWLAVIALFVAVCRIAADADAGPSPATGPPTGSIGQRLILSSSQPAPAPHSGRAHRARSPLSAGHPARRRRVAAHGIR
jgi:hypothetical protein